MNCTVCKNPMMSLEMDSVEADYCPSCEGIWLDSGELELLLGSSPRVESLVRSFQKVLQNQETIHPCPICDRKMEKVNAGTNDSPVVIDRCPKEHGLWFDRGELAAVLKKGCFDPEMKVKKLLGNLFGASDQADNVK